MVFQNFFRTKSETSAKQLISFRQHTCHYTNPEINFMSCGKQQLTLPKCGNITAVSGSRSSQWFESSLMGYARTTDLHVPVQGSVTVYLMCTKQQNSLWSNIMPWLLPLVMFGWHRLHAFLTIIHFTVASCECSSSKLKIVKTISEPNVKGKAM